MTSTPCGLSLSAPSACRSKSLPTPLKWSLLAHVSFTGFIFLKSLLDQQLDLSVAAGLALAAFLGISWTLSHGTAEAWRAACHCSVVGLCATAFGTLILSVGSPAAVLTGICFFCLQLGYVLTLHAKPTYQYFAQPQPIGTPEATKRQRWLSPRKLRGVTNAVLLVVVIGQAADHVAAAPQFENAFTYDLDTLIKKVPDTFEKKRDAVSKRLKVYRSWAKKYREAAIQDLNDRHDLAKRTGGPLSQQAIHVKATYDWLLDKAGPPKDKAAIGWMADFVNAHSVKQMAVWKPLAILIRELNKAENQSEAAQLHHAFLALESPRPFPTNLLLDYTFRGYRVAPDGKSMRSMQFTFSAGDDSQWSGTVALDPGYRTHPVYEFSGGFIGPYLIAQTGVTKAFGNKGDRAWTYRASLFRTSIIGTYSGRDKKGKLEKGLFMLHRK